jgi:hypothetical protein
MSFVTFKVLDTAWFSLSSANEDFESPIENKHLAAASRLDNWVQARGQERATESAGPNKGRKIHQARKFSKCANKRVFH